MKKVIGSSFTSYESFLDLRFNWNAPMAISEARPDRFYMGSQYLHKSDDMGDTWEIISGDLTTNDESKQQQEKSGGISRDNSGAENHCTIFTIAESPLNENIIWVGTDDGNIQGHGRSLAGDVTCGSEAPTP